MTLCHILPERGGVGKYDIQYLLGSVWFYGITTIVGYLMSTPLVTYMLNTRFLNTFSWNIILLYYKNTSISTNSISHKSTKFQAFLCINSSIKHSPFSLNTDISSYVFLTIQFNITHLSSYSLNVSFTWHMDRTLSGATTPGQKGSGSDGNKRILRISQSSRITWASLSGSLVSYPGHSLD